MSEIGPPIYVIKRPDGSVLHSSDPIDALYIYDVFVRAYGEDNVQLGTETRVYTSISLEDLKRFVPPDHQP